MVRALQICQKYVAANMVRSRGPLNTRQIPHTQHTTCEQGDRDYPLQSKGGPMTDTSTSLSSLDEVLPASSRPTPPPAAVAAMRSIVNPATGEILADVPDHDAADVDAAVEVAKAAFESGPWPAMTRTARARLLLRMADAIEA